MSFMFYNCKNFNSDISKWDVRKVKNTSFMFENCTRFDCDLSKWDIRNIRDMRDMFDDSGMTMNPIWYEVDVRRGY